MIVNNRAAAQQHEENFVAMEISYAEQIEKLVMSSTQLVQLLRANYPDEGASVPHELRLGCKLVRGVPAMKVALHSTSTEPAPVSETLVTEFLCDESFILEFWR